jgi:hypothetical protein
MELLYFLLISLELALKAPYLPSFKSSFKKVSSLVIYRTYHEVRKLSTQFTVSFLR